MPLVPTKMADAQCSVSGNHWPGGQRDMLTTTSARVNSSPAFLSHLQDGIFYKYVVFKHPLSLFDQISPQQQHHEWASQTFIYNDYETLSRLTIEKGHFKLAILFVA